MAPGIQAVMSKRKAVQKKAGAMMTMSERQAMLKKAGAMLNHQTVMSEPKADQLEVKRVLPGVELCFDPDSHVYSHPWAEWSTILLDKSNTTLSSCR